MESSEKLLCELRRRSCYWQLRQARSEWGAGRLPDLIFIHRKGRKSISDRVQHEQKRREKERSSEYIWITPNISVWQEPKAGEEHNPLFKILSIKFNKQILKYWLKDYCLLSNVLILGATVGVQGKVYSKQGRKIKLLASILLPGASLHSTLIERYHL